MKDYARVSSTQEERDEWRNRPNNRGRTGTPYRVMCRSCGTRYWLSGIAVGAHRRHCKIAPFDDHDQCRGCGSHISDPHATDCLTDAAVGSRS